MLKTSVLLNHPRERLLVPIVADAFMLSAGVAEGRAIPVLILDTSLRPDIDDLVRAHEHLGPGDAKTLWVYSGLLGRRHQKLIVEFERPQRCVIVLQFSIAEHGGIVDQIVQSELVYLQPGRPGDRLKNTTNCPRVTVEVSTDDFRKHWDRIWRREIGRDFRKRGLSRARVPDAVESLICEWRELWAQRMSNE